MVKLTPLDIQQQQFKIKFRGFDIREVDAFLEQMADTFETLKFENENFVEEVRKLRSEIQGHRNREETFKRAMLNSQKVMEQMKENAQKSAELIIAEAEIESEKLLKRAHTRLAQLHEDITELKRQRLQIEVQISSVLEAHTRLLDMSKEGMKAMDDEDSKVKLLTKSG